MKNEKWVERFGCIVLWIVFFALVLFVHNDAKAQPYKSLEINSEWQQLQSLPDLDVMQGANMELRVQLVQDGYFADIAGLTARFEARADYTSTNYYVAASSWTDNLNHEISIMLNSEQTGDVLTNFLYSIIIVSGENEFPLGVGKYNVQRSTFTGVGKILSGAPDAITRFDLITATNNIIIYVDAAIAELPTSEAVSNIVNSAIAPLATTNQLNSVSNNLQAQIDLRLTNEVDLLAKKLEQYGTTDITITPESAFTFDGMGTITAYSGTYTDIVIPYEIGGVAVTAIGYGVFVGDVNIVTITAGKNLVTIEDDFAYNCASLTTITLPNVTTIGDYFASDCGSLTTITLPSVTTIGDYFVSSCASLTSVSFSANAPTIGSSYPYGGTPNVTNYVLNSTATGWTDTFRGRPVVFPSHTLNDLEIKGDATINGVEIATTNQLNSVSNNLQAQIEGVAVAGSNYTDNAVAGVTVDTSDLAKLSTTNTFAEKQKFTKGFNVLGGVSDSTSVAIGNNSVAYTNSIAIGGGAKAEGLNSTAVGVYATASGVNSTAIGNRALATDDYEIQIGRIGFATHIDMEASGDITFTSSTGKARFNGVEIATTSITNGLVDTNALNSAIADMVTSDYDPTNTISSIWQGSATQFGNLATTNSATMYLIWE